MTENFSEMFSQTYLNPVYPRSFPDPFVLKFRNEYFAYCTDFWREGKVFGVLHSRDLVNWQEIGGAMQRLETDAPFYWAPEVTYHNGKFYLYYSVGNETLMELRVAVSDRPESGFVDAGVRLTNEEFAIDAHVFEDEDGERYLFYATDFLTHTHIGTGTVVDRMLNWFTLEGKPRPVTRAKYDWQVYDPQRKEKGGVRWHTIEGSFVLKRKGIYYQMFSGGNWQNITYGVSFAVTGDIKRDEEWAQFSDGVKIFPILRTIPDLIVGPGHNSVVRGVNNRELFCVYHRWTEHGRVLSIDRMNFTGDARMIIKGATHTPQPAPFVPKFSDHFDEISAEKWKILAGDWRIENNQIISRSNEYSEIACNAAAESFLCEIWLRGGEETVGNFGVSLNSGGENIFKFSLVPNEKKAVWSRLENSAGISENFALPDEFDFQAFHLLRIEADHQWFRIMLDENTLRFEKTIPGEFSQISLWSENISAAFSGFSLTSGFEDLFENDDLNKKGWQVDAADGECLIENSNLKLVGGDRGQSLAAKKMPAGNFELVVNFRVTEIKNRNFRIGFYPVFANQRGMSAFLLEAGETHWVLKSPDGTQIFDLPDGYLPDVFHQICFLKIGNKIIVCFETKILGVVEIKGESEQIALAAENGTVEFDMVRLTNI